GRSFPRPRGKLRTHGNISEVLVNLARNRAERGLRSATPEAGVLPDFEMPVWFYFGGDIHSARPETPGRARNQFLVAGVAGRAMHHFRFEGRAWRNRLPRIAGGVGRDPKITAAM